MVGGQKWSETEYGLDAHAASVVRPCRDMSRDSGRLCAALSDLCHELAGMSIAARAAAFAALLTIESLAVSGDPHRAFVSPDRDMVKSSSAARRARDSRREVCSLVVGCLIRLGLPIHIPHHQRSHDGMQWAGEDAMRAIELFIDAPVVLQPALHGPFPRTNRPEPRTHHSLRRMAVGIEQLSRDTVVQASVESLGLDADTLDLDTPESLAALRRTASLRCPIGTHALLDATVTVLDGLATHDDLRSELSELLRAMVAYGDLVELTPPADQTGSARLLYLAPPTFVQTVAGTFVLLGIGPEGAPLVNEALLPSIRYEHHTRTISGEDPEAVVASLKASGLQEINQARWLRAPPRHPRVGRR